MRFLLGDVTSKPAWVAIGLSASTLVWTVFWSVWQNRKSTRPRLKGRTSLAIPVFPTGPIKTYLSVEAANVGAVPATLSSVLLVVRGTDQTLAVTRWFWETPEPLPARLEPGAGHWTGFADPAELLLTLSREFGERRTWHVRADFGIVGGRRFRSTAGRLRWRPWQTRWTRLSA
jgi:hypothetical protein